MAYLPKLEFANFHLTFGDNLRLLDLFEDVVIPAFLDEAFERKYGTTTYRFLDVRLVNVTDGGVEIPAIFGRLLKDMVIYRPQVMENGQLVEQEVSLPSAETSLFLLLLDTHRLLYLQETQFAPGLRAFRTSALQALQPRLSSFVNQIYGEFKSEGTSNSLESISALEGRNPQKFTKKAIRELLGAPLLEVVPLGTEASLEGFLQRFSLLQRVQVDVIKTNDELNNDALFAQVKLQGESFGTKTPQVVHENSDGLIKAHVQTALAQPISQGTVAASFRGKDESLNLLKGDASEFAVRMPVKNLPGIGDMIGRAKRMFSMFSAQRQSGALIVPEASDAVKEKLVEIGKRFEMKEAIVPDANQ